MNELLKWSILNSATADEDAPARLPGERSVQQKNFEPEIIDAILGKSDAVVLKENMQTMVDKSRPLDEREQAFDNFEMLIEHIDNACDLEPLGMWPKLVQLLSDDETATRMHAAWICGTAIQNNPKAQLAFLNASGLPPLLRLLREEDDPAVRTKAMYALAGLIKNFVAGYTAFEIQGGWDVLKRTVEDEVPAVRKKTIALLNSLAAVNPKAAITLVNEGFPDRLVSILDRADQNAGAEVGELVLRALLTLRDQEETVGQQILDKTQQRRLANALPKLKWLVSETFAEQEWATLESMGKL